MFATLLTTLFQTGIYNPQIVDPEVRSYLDPNSQIGPAGFFNRLVNYFLYWAFLLGAVVFFFMVVAGGITWITSAGDKQKLETARRWLTNGGVGLALLFFLFVFISIINSIFNINIMRVGSSDIFRIIIDPIGDAFENLRNIGPQDALTYLVQLVLIFAVIFFFFMLVIGGIRWIASGGDKIAIEAARKTVTNALVGLLIVFSIFSILYFINSLFGIDIGGLGEGPRGGCYAGCVGDQDCEPPLTCDTSQNWCYDLVACANVSPPDPTNTPTQNMCTPPIASGTFTCDANYLADIIWSWMNVPGATVYRLQTSTSQDYTNPLLNVTTSNTSYNWNNQTPRDYYMRVRVETSDNSCVAPSLYYQYGPLLARCPTPTPTYTPPPGPIPGTYVNEASGFNCNQICSLNGSSCYDIGVDNNASDNRIATYAWSGNQCGYGLTGNCNSYISSDGGPNCNGYNTLWTYCRCIP